jgi:hypothetical protein
MPAFLYVYVENADSTYIVGATCGRSLRACGNGVSSASAYPCHGFARLASLLLAALRIFGTA